MSDITPYQNEGGLGISPDSPLLRAKPSTLQINQPMTAYDGAIKGKLRVKETNQQFASLTCAFLAEPTMSRAYHGRTAGQSLYKNPQNLLCFSRDLIRPDTRSKEQQSATCATCSKGDMCWETWNESKRPEDKPQCDKQYNLLLLTTDVKTPLRMFLTGTNRSAFGPLRRRWEAAFNQIRVDTGFLPNIYDIVFTLSTIKPNGANNWVLNMSDFQLITPELRDKFGRVFKEAESAYAKQAQQSRVDESARQVDARMEEIEELMGDIQL